MKHTKFEQTAAYFEVYEFFLDKMAWIELQITAIITYKMKN